MAYCGTELVVKLSQVLRDELGFVDVAEYNSFIGGTLIPQVEDFIDNYCGGRDGTLRRFNSNLGTIQLNGLGKGVLFFPPYFTPLLGVGSLTVDGVAVANSSLKLSRQFIEYDGGAFRKGAKNVYFVGTHGYSGTVPLGIRYVCGQLCANMLLDMKRRKRSDMVSGVDASNFSSMLGDPAFLSSPWIFTPDMRRVLDNHHVSWIDLG